jgi:hypothetical protein
MAKIFKNINKKVLITVLLAVVVFASGLTWILVDASARAFKPVNMNLTAAARATVSGNGGNAVIVGDYVYYIGNYVDTTTIVYKQNEYNAVSYGAIYRVKLTGGVPGYQATANAHFTEGKNTYRTEGVELIVPKIAGFQNSALYVFDKYLIYTSPNNTKDKQGQLQPNKIDFFRVDLDGRDHRRIYSTESDIVSRTDFTVAGFNGSYYLLIKDGDKLLRVAVSGSAGKTDTISEKATGFVLPVVTDYAKSYNAMGQVESAQKSMDASFGGIMNFLYYTEEYTEDEGRNGFRGNRVVQYQWYGDGAYKTVGGLDAEGAGTNNKIYGLNGLSNGRLMYTISTYNAAAGELPGLYITDNTDKAPFGSGADQYMVQDFRHAEESFYLPTQLDGTDPADINTHRYVSRIVPSAEGSKSSMNIYSGASAAPVKTIADVSEIIQVTDSLVYYKDGASGNIMVVSLADGNPHAHANAFAAEGANGRVTVFYSNTTGERYFYVKTFTEGTNTTTCAVMADAMTGGTVKEYILGTVGDEFIPEMYRG